MSTPLDQEIAILLLTIVIVVPWIFLALAYHEVKTRGLTPAAAPYNPSVFN